MLVSLHSEFPRSLIIPTYKHKIKLIEYTSPRLSLTNTLLLHITSSEALMKYVVPSNQPHLR